MHLPHVEIPEPSEMHHPLLQQAGLDYHEVNQTLHILQGFQTFFDLLHSNSLSS